LTFPSGWDRSSSGHRDDRGDARLKHGADLLAQNKPDSAARVFRAVLKEFPDSAIGYALLAMALADMGRGRDALFSAELALARDPHLALSHAARACALEAMGQPWEAEMECRQAVACAPNDPNRYSDLAGIVGRSGRYKEALDITSKGLSLNPQHLPSLHCRALALVSLGRPDDAFDVLDSALLEDEDLAQLHASIGVVLEAKGDLDRAAEEFRQSLLRDPAVKEARDGLARLASRRNRLLPTNWLRKGR
jgi:tetratricopeptide (TPR) repeat protein